MNFAASRQTLALRLVLGALIIATAAKLAWATHSAGSVDAVYFFNFARAIGDAGLCALYPADVRFNHTPLTGSFAWTLYRVAGGDFQTFSFLLRLASTLADAVTVIALLRWRTKIGARTPWWAIALLAASPVSIMVSGFHGNVDPIMVAVLFLAAIASTELRPILSGILFGLACSVKIVPLVLAPVFFFFWLARGKALRFTIASAAVGLGIAALPLVVCPGAYLHNVLGYGSTWGVWGVPYWLRLTGWSAVQKIDFHDLTATQSMIATLLKVAAVGGIALLGWRRRLRAPAELAATIGAAWLVFFVCAPGIGVQYMVWPAPFLLLLSARSFAAFTAAATIFLAVFYHATSQGRWFLAIPRGPETPLWSAWGTLVWVALLAALCAELWRARTAAVSDSADS